MLLLLLMLRVLLLQCSTKHIAAADSMLQVLCCVSELIANERHGIGPDPGELMRRLVSIRRIRAKISAAL